VQVNLPPGESPLQRDPLGDALPPVAVPVEQDEGDPLGDLQVQLQLERRHAEGRELARSGAAQVRGGQVVDAADGLGEGLYAARMRARPPGAPRSAPEWP